MPRRITDRKSKLTATRAREVWKYDPKTGLLWWKERDSRRQMDRPAGSLDFHGYIGVGHLGRIYKAHRLIWLLQTGQWPVDEIDHKNGNRSDNRWKNLREATRHQNKANSTTYKNNTLGHKGVSWHVQHKKWYVSVQKNGKPCFVGLFTNYKTACAAARRTMKTLHGEFVRLA